MTDLPGKPALAMLLPWPVGEAPSPTEEGLNTFSADDAGDRSKTVARTINLSLGLLDPPQRARFAELAVFPEDTEIPIGVVARLWCMTAGLSERATKDLLGRFYGLSLLLALDLNLRTLRFHDTIRHFLQDQAGADGVVAGHKRVVVALDGVATAAESDASSRKYYYLHLPDHLAAAGERERLDKLLLDPAWLQTKLDATSPQALAADYERPGRAGQAQNLVGHALRLTVGICARDRRQLMPQLLGRLMAIEDPAIKSLLDAGRRVLRPSAMLTRTPSLTPPGAETARLEGHAHDVSAFCLLPDGRLASGSSDKTIRLWDPQRGAETARLEGHTDEVVALCLLPDGLASGSSDKTIRLWDPQRGAETARLEGHTDWVTALCLLPEGRLSSVPHIRLRPHCSVWP